LLTRTGGRGEHPEWCSEAVLISIAGKSSLMKEVQAELGRRLREEYITAPSPARPPLVKIATASATALRAEERAAGRRTASSDFHPLEGDKSLRIESEQVPSSALVPHHQTAGTAHWCIGCRATLSLPTNIFG
jgi:hypothetical protein